MKNSKPAAGTQGFSRICSGGRSVYSQVYDEKYAVQCDGEYAQCIQINAEGVPPLSFGVTKG